MAFFTCAAAWANTSAEGLVDAPLMKRGLLKALVVPHNSSMPVSSCFFFARATIWSRFLFVSVSVFASGAMSRSWKHQ